MHRDHHRAQHDFGSELEWWSAHGKDPFYLALTYNARYTRETGKDPTVNTVRPKRPSAVAERASKPRVSEAKRRPGTHGRPPGGSAKAKIANRKTPWPAKGTRKLQSRKFRKE